MAEVDLDRLAAGYRHRPPSRASLERARLAGEGLHSGSAILDVGGGPGHHAGVWRDLGHRPVVLDPAREMIRTAADAARFPESPAIEAYLRKATNEVDRTTVIEHKAPTAGGWVAAVEAGFVSTLQFVDAHELRTGIAAFCAANRDPTVEVAYELRLDHIVATAR